jgi:hypothetical protein
MTFYISVYIFSFTFLALLRTPDFLADCWIATTYSEQKDKHPKNSKELTLWNIILHEKLIIAQPVNTFVTFYGSRRHITILTIDRHWSLFWATWIKCILSDSLSFRIHSHPRLGLPNFLFSSGFRLKFIMHLSCVLHCLADLSFV